MGKFKASLPLIAILLTSISIAYTATRDSNIDSKEQVEKLEIRFLAIDKKLNLKVNKVEDDIVVAKYERQQEELRKTTVILNNTLIELNTTMLAISKTLEPVGEDMNKIENRTIINTSRIVRIEQDVSQIKKR